MRTKIAILSAAALAAGLLSSNAQVYSANVVGYVNITVPGGGAFTVQTAPLQVTSPGINLATNVFGMNPANDGNLSFLILNPAAHAYFPEVYQNSAQATWYEDINGVMQPTPSLPVGTGFVVHNSSPIFTNTEVGNVIGWNNVTLTFSNGVVLPDGLSSRASPLPIAVTLGAPGNNSLTNNPAKFIDGLGVVQVVGGVNTTVYYDPGSPTGFSDINGIQKPAPVLPVGSSVIFINDGSSFYGHAGIPWNQTLP